MPFVLDASVVHDWALGERHPTAGAIRDRLNTDSALATSLWWFEVRNGLIMAERRRRSSEEYSAAFLRRLLQFPVTIDHTPNEATVMALARRHRLTVYDASYLELALREALPLATLDGSLATAARQEGVEVLGDGA
jgi:predicted nucleic acid-binding protein